MYNPLNWYWIIANNETNVWSSSRLLMVPAEDAAYQLFLGNDMPTRISAKTDLIDVMKSQTLPNLWEVGVQLVSTGSPEINATYSLTEADVDVIRIVAQDIGAGFGLEDDATSYDYYDILGNTVTLQVDSIVPFYLGLRNYKSRVTSTMSTRINGGTASMPATPVTIV